MANGDDIFSSDEPDSSLFDDNQFEPQTVDAPEYYTEEEAPAEMSGLCPKCLNTGFVHGTDREGRFGVLFSTAGEDSTGKSKRRLVICGHNLNVGY